MKQDIYQKVTDKIIADLEKGQLTWLKPWSTGNMDGRIMKPLRHNGMPYNGINVLMLWAASVEAGYVSPHWMTFKQAKELGANVRKGEQYYTKPEPVINGVERIEHAEALLAWIAGIGRRSRRGGRRVMRRLLFS